MSILTTTTRPINVSQLGHELGRVALRCVGPDDDGETTIRTDDVDLATLGAAVAAHVADGAWVDPDAPAFPPLPPSGVLALTLFLGGKLATPEETVACCGFPEAHLNHEALAWLAAAGS